MEPSYTNHSLERGRDFYHTSYQDYSLAFHFNFNTPRGAKQPTGLMILLEWEFPLRPWAQIIFFNYFIHVNARNKLHESRHQISPGMKNVFVYIPYLLD